MKNLFLIALTFVAAQSFSLPAFAISSLSFDLPAAGTIINLQNTTKLAFKGNCDVAGESITLVAGASSSLTTTCLADKTWTFANISVAAQADGPIAFKISNSSGEILKTLIKDTYMPTLVINSPKNGDSIIASNFKSFAVNGICSELNQPIQIIMKRAIDDGVTAPIVQNLVCPSARQWSTAFDLTTLGDNTDIQLMATHTDSAGNQTIQSASYYMDVQLISTSFAGLPPFINTLNAASTLINGTCNKNNSTITLDASVGGTPYAQSLTTNCTNGKWQFNTVSFAGATVPDGALSLTLSLLNPLTGQIGTTTTTIMKDTVAPTLAITSPALGYRMTATSGMTLTVAGSCSENGSSVAISGPVSSSAVCSSGTFSSSLNLSALPDGDKAYSVTHSDALGNSTTQSFSFNKDVLPATLTVNPITTINASNATTMQFTGTCSEFGAYAQPVDISGAISATAICQSTGTWSLNLSSFSIADGSVTFNFDHKDAAGNAAAQISKTVSKDTLPPTLTITSPVLPVSPAKFMINKSNISTVTFGGACSDGTATITASGALTSTVACSAGAWTMSGAGLATRADGDQAINFTITDPAANSLTQSIIVFKDTVDPTLTLVGSPYAINIASTNNVIINGSCSEYGSFAQPVTISGLTGGPYSAICNSPGNWTLSIAKTNFAEGTSNFTVLQNDLAGNSTTVSGQVIKDSLPPTLTLATGSGLTAVNASNVSSFSLKGTCSENGRSITISGASAATTTCSSNIWSTAVNISGLADGNLSFTASHSDLGGNVVTQNIVVTKDVTAPTLSVLSPAEASDVASATTFSISGYCSEIGRVVTISGSYSGTASCAANQWALSVSAGNLQTASITAVLSDAAGNSTNVLRKFTNSKVAPILPVLMPTKIATGSSHTCAIVSGALKCWGNNGYGQLGNGSKINSLTPVTVIASGVQAVAVGDYHTCALASGSLQCWGYNNYGQLGNGSTINSSTPVTVIASGVQAVAARGSYTCSIVSGSLQCWGYNVYGQLGNGSTVSSSTPVTVIASGVQTVAAGDYHTCALVSGSLQCWGYNYYGQFGNGSTINSSTPVTVIASGVENVAAGGGHTCAIVSGALKCWGNNGYGQLGNGSTIKSSTAVTVIASGVQTVAAGGSYTCAIVSGSLQCWGYNYDGQLGNGSTTRVFTPVTVISSGVQNVTAGDHHTCAIVSGSLQCWGKNVNGQLGNGSTSDFSTPVTVIASGVQAVAGGGDHTCAIVSGALNCWGNNGFGQLGISSANLSAPVTVIASGVQAVAASGDYPGASHTCAIVNGALRCWGNNGYGQLGNGSRINSSTPVTVIASGVQAVAAGDYHTCAIVSGSLQCWGYNYYGQLGNGSRIDSSMPVTVIASGVEAVTAGDGHTCAIVSGSLQCWGKNGYGQLGNGSSSNSLTPVTVISSGVQAVAAGGSYTCAIVSGSLQCWGYNTYGQLGIGSTTFTSSIPVTVIASGVQAVAVGLGHTCAVSGLGQLACWGRNDYAQANPAQRLKDILPGTTILTGL